MPIRPRVRRIAPGTRARRSPGAPLAARLTVMATCVLAVACSVATVPDVSFDVYAGEDGLEVVNMEAEDRWFVAIDAETLALVDVDFDPVHEPEWTRIPAGQSRLIPWERVWVRTPGSRTFRVLSWIRSVEVPGDEGSEWIAYGLSHMLIEI